MSNSTTQPGIAFIAATGGCALAALAHTLKAGIPVVALARTPSKLTSLLEAQKVDSKTISRLLTIVTGSAHDVAAVKATLAPNGKLVDTIITGLGGTGKVQWSWKLHIFVLDDPQICEKGIRTTMDALKQIYEEQANAKPQQPLLTFISTTGISRGPEDVPFWYRFFYHQMLHIPHVDKRITEDLIRNNVDGKDGGEKLFRIFIGVRPTLLFGTGDLNEGVGSDNLRVGTEANPTIGYTMKRADVGQWIFKNVVESTEKRRQWEDQIVTLAY